MAKRARTTAVEHYWIATAICKEAVNANGVVVTQAGEMVLLSWTPEGGGWPTNVRISREDVAHPEDLVGAYRFSERPSPAQLAGWNGAPWYYRFDAATVIEIDVATVVTKTVDVAVSDVGPVPERKS